ncbi:hypothetical protein RVU96_17605 [Bordetella avium]|uniref:hypothetical protein n=2 Tax=Bordetella avium TaxID=521 RepID=UPI000E18F0F8|nr:hypothetical protein [Bordetella avium]RIQ11917.1 hypothetical protein D0432_14675 [Bordetella avium]RIQ43710.1 hypothetical protein D0845_17710 [Bordetella avium]RIQ48462.1 hypothetical protein D0844_17155 [Bordetella avium]RIQ57794.1 hypothetical protein D0842_17315 [Bordetella avium]RIQ58446.1 hypothetical protein D0840_17165 [Bordetella avium]
MNAITINIDDYLTAEEKRQIAREEFRSACARRSAEEFERILSNAAYDLVHKEVDAAFSGDMVETVRTQAMKVINSMSSHTVFSPPNAWDRAPSKGYLYLQEAIEAARPAVAERVLAIIDTMSAIDLRERIEDLVCDAIIGKLTAPSKVAT